MSGISNLNSKNVKAIDSGTGADKLLSNSITSFNFDGSLSVNIEHREIKDIPVGSVIFLQSPGTSSNPVPYKISKINKDPQTLLYNVFYFTDSKLYEVFTERSPLMNVSANIVSGVATITVPSTVGMFAGVSLEKVDGDGVFGADYPIIQSVDSPTQITLTTNHNTSGYVLFNVREDRGKYIGTEKFHAQVQVLNTNSLGEEGWALTSQGEAIFSNIYARGHIEAASGSITGILEVGTNNAENAYMLIGSDLFDDEPFENIAKQHNGIYIDDENYLLTYPQSNDKTITSVVITNPQKTRTKKTIILDLLSHQFVLGTTSDGSVDPTEYLVLSGLTGDLAELNGTQRVTALTTTSVSFSVYSTTAFSSTYTGLSALVQKHGNYDPYSCSSISVESVSDPITYNLVRFNVSGNVLEAGQLIDVDGLTGDLLSLNSSFQIVDAGSSYVSVEKPGSLITPNTYAQTGTISSLSNNTKFRIGSIENFMKYDSLLNSLSVSGTINASAGNFTDTVTIGKDSAQGKLQVGTATGVGSSWFEIIGTDNKTTTVIKTKDASYGTSGVWLSADGKFSLGNQLTFSNGNLVIAGGVTATSFNIDANNYWNTAGNEGDFRVGNASTYMFWNKTGTDTGTLQVKGQINATSGTIDGDFQINGDAVVNGSVFVGGSPTTGQRVAINDSGIIGVDNSNITVFNLPATGTDKPTMTNFNILEAKITGAGSNAYLIAGTTGVDANNVIVRGDKSVPGQAAAIYSTISGTATSATTGNGFYLDDTGKFRFAQGSNVITGSEGSLSVTGEIKATSGYIGGTTSGWLINSSRITNDAGLFGAGLIATSAPITSYNLAQNPQAAGSGKSLGYGGIPGFQVNTRYVRCGAVNNGSYGIDAPFSTQYRFGEVKLMGSQEFAFSFDGTTGSTSLTSLQGVTNISVGMYVSGPGIPNNTTVVGFNGTTLVISNPVTTTGGRTVIFWNQHSFSRLATGTSGQLTISVSSTPFPIQTGFYVSGTGIGAGATVVSVVGTTVTLSVANSGTVSASILFASPFFPIIDTYGGYDFTTYTFNTGQYMLSAYFYVPVSSSFAGKQITLRAAGSLVSNHWQNVSFSPVTLVGGSWVRATTLVSMGTAGAGAPIVTATINGVTSIMINGGQIFTSSWMISPGSTLQDYFDESFPMGVDAGGYATEYEQVLYSGSTYNSRSGAALQLGHGGNIYATVGKIGGFNLASNQIYIETPSGNFSLGDLSPGGDYPEYGLSINSSNVWNQSRFQMEQTFALMNSDLEPPMIKIDSAAGSIHYDALGGTDWSPADLFGAGSGGSVVLGHITDPDNTGLYHQVSGITSNYYDIVGEIMGSTYLYQGEPFEWYMGPNLTVRGSLSAGPISGSTGNFSSSVTASTFYTSNWFRSRGNSGWYNENHGGGIFMQDSTYVRVYNNKSFLVGSGHGGVDASATVLTNSGDTYSNRYLLYENHPEEAAYYGSAYMYNGNASSSGRKTLYLSSTGVSPNYRMTVAPSGLKFKDNILEFVETDEKLEAYLNINPVTFNYKSAITAAEESGKSLEDVELELGFIANDFQDAGLTMLYQTDSDGIADYLAYDRLPVYNFMIIKKQQEKIKNLEDSLVLLENRLAALES
jgi:hypothetical protein